MKETGTDEYPQSIVGVTTAVCSQVLSWAVPQVKGVNLSAQWGFLQQNISLSLFSYTALPPGRWAYAALQRGNGAERCGDLSQCPAGKTWSWGVIPFSWSQTWSSLQDPL